MHLAGKPIALVADALLDGSARGDIVLGPFLGSGTTILAAERTGRVSHGIELDPLHIDLAVRRWQRIIGGTAVHAVSDMTFADVEQAKAPKKAPTSIGYVQPPWTTHFRKGQSANLLDRPRGSLNMATVLL